MTRQEIIEKINDFSDEMYKLARIEITPLALNDKLMHVAKETLVNMSYTLETLADEL